ncbi:MAG: 50S ribosomal protein L29 [bacterium]
MKANDIREKSVEELQVALDDQLKEQFNLRMRKSTGQLEQSHKLNEARKNIARIKTVLREKAVN